MRLDKWLWAARFYKTRALASAAVEGGKVHLNGQRTKPGKPVQVGSRVTVQRDGLSWDIVVAVLPTQRRPASEARQFYAESDASRERREAAIAAQREARLAAPSGPASRPSKRDRRLIHRFKSGSGS